MAAWVLPVAMGLGSAAVGSMGAKNQDNTTTTSYNSRQGLEPLNFYNWHATPEQNQEENMTNVLYGKLMNAIWGLMDQDKMLKSLLAGGLGQAPNPRAKMRAADRARGAGGGNATI